MSDATADLQKALFAALTSDAGVVSLLGGAKVFDHAPAHVGFPYVTFGRASIHDWSTDTDRGSEHLLAIHIWSKARGKKEAFAIMARVQAVLDDTSLYLEHHHLFSLRLVASEVAYDDDIDVHRGLLRFRAVTEAPA